MKKLICLIFLLPCISYADGNLNVETTNTNCQVYKDSKLVGKGKCVITEKSRYISNKNAFEYETIYDIKKVGTFREIMSESDKKYYTLDGVPSKFYEKNGLMCSESPKLKICFKDTTVY